MSVICLIDNTEHECIEHLHIYLRKLKVTQEKYYTNFLNKRDLFTGDPIPFKDAEQYLNTSFTDKRHLKKWVKANPVAGKEWCINWLKKRIETKKLVFAPTQAELNSLSGPTMHYFETIGGYNNICQSLGLKIRFNSSDIVYKSLPKDATLIIDTREQYPLDIKMQFKVDTVNTGDYAIADPYDKKIYIERKSMMDFMGTLSKDLGRFNREIERAKENSAYLVVLIECPMADVVSMDYKRKKMKHLAAMKATSSHIFRNMREIMKTFENIQFLFVENRDAAAKAVIKIFELGESAKDIDLQYKYETKELEF